MKMVSPKNAQTVKVLERALGLIPKASSPVAHATVREKLLRKPRRLEDYLFIPPSHTRAGVCCINALYAPYFGHFCYTASMQRGFLDTRLLIGSFVLFLVLIAGFATTRAYGLVEGPRIVLAPVQIEDGFVTLEGTVYRGAYFSINGRTVAPEQNGNFSEHLLLTPGHTIMSIEARDRFDRTTKEIIPIYVPEYASEKTSSEEDSPEEGGASGE